MSESLCKARSRSTCPDSEVVGVELSTISSGLSTAHIMSRRFNLKQYATGSQCIDIIALLTLSRSPRSTASQKMRADYTLKICNSLKTGEALKSRERGVVEA